ncbi:MAG: hypothetical protein KC486_28050, partial [Myxococcales bacterium]|nr:hypothetical protein [Myxococcales bacterium]
MGPDSSGARGRAPASRLRSAEAVDETRAAVDAAIGAALDETRISGEPGGERPRRGGPLDETRISGEAAADERAGEASVDETRVSDGASAATVRAALDVTAPADPHATLVSGAARASDVTAADGIKATLVSGRGAGVGAAGAGGQRIDRFVILRALGSGGMGAVYAAYDEELARRVALKILHGSEAYPEDSRAALLAEARAMARL